MATSLAASDVSLGDRSGRSLSTQQAALLLRDRALQLKLLPHHQRVGQVPSSPWDRLLPRPWPPSDRRHEYWLLLLSVLAIAGAFATPFRLAFLPSGLRPGLSAYELCIDIVYLVDVLIHTLFVLPARLPEATCSEVAAHYAASGHLLRDLTAALPLDFIFYGGGVRN